MLKILGNTTGTPFPSLLLINPAWCLLPVQNDPENLDGGIKVNIRDGKPSAEVKEVQETPKPKKKSNLRVVK